MPTDLKVVIAFNRIASALLWLFACAMGGVVVALAGCDRQAPAVAFSSVDVTGADFGREFRLVDPDGRIRTLADFRGQYVMLLFGFTQCPDVCPTALARAVEVRNKLGADRARVQVIFVTLDPERDTPEALRAYVQAFDPSFLGLHGDAEQTRQVAGEFRVFYQKVPTGRSYTVDHTAITYLLDPQGRLRLAVRPDQPADQVAADLRALMGSSS